MPALCGVDYLRASIRRVRRVDLLNAEAVSVIPGSIFGQQWHRWIRLSYARQSEDRLRTAAERIVRFFS